MRTDMVVHSGATRSVPLARHRVPTYISPADCLVSVYCSRALFKKNENVRIVSPEECNVVRYGHTILIVSLDLLICLGHIISLSKSIRSMGCSQRHHICGMVATSVSFPYTSWKMPLWSETIFSNSCTFVDVPSGTTRIRMRQLIIRSDIAEKSNVLTIAVATHSNSI